MGRTISCITRRASFSMLIFLLLLHPPPFVEDAAADATSPVPVSELSSQRIHVGPGNGTTGFTLVAPFNQKDIYLVDHEGNTVHSWRASSNTKGTVEMLDDGTLIRGRSGYGGQSDGIQILGWDGTVRWDWTPPAEFDWHHGIEPMPNGNFLINAVVDYLTPQAVALGRDPDLTPGHLRVEPIVEVRPNGTSGGDVVWMWDPMDHIIQDYDPEKPNYGVVEDHPELVDINYPAVYSAEWQHSNAVAYNPELDQVVITNRDFDEFWVIDHNTTIYEAAGHTGGAQGKGGDILYRWGNPEAYGASNSTNHILYGPHNVHWIPPGLPGGGNFLVFNNGNNLFMTRPEGRITTLEEIAPPVNESGGYPIEAGSAFGPSDSEWRYNSSPPEDFFVWSMGSAQRLPDGNTLVGGGSTGEIFEIDTDGNVVWEYKVESVFEVSRYYPPALDPVPIVRTTEDVPLSIDLTPYISDLDTEVASLVLGCDSPFVNVSGNELLLQYPDGVTSDVINMTLSDGIFEVGREVRVNVTPVNDPPVLAPLPDVDAIESQPHLLDLAPYIADPDTPIDDMDVRVDSPYVTVEGAILMFLYPDGVLTETVTVYVSDGEFEVQSVIHVEIQPVDYPPTVDPLPDQEGVEDVPWTFDMRPYINDLDTPLQDIMVTTSSRYASFSGHELVLLYPEGVTSDVVPIIVSDGLSEALVYLNVTIEPVNDPPEITPLDPVTIREEESFTLDVDPYLSDVDTPGEDLTLVVDSPYVEIVGHLLVILYPEGGLVDDLIVEVWDGELGDSSTLVVTVGAVNDAPVIEDMPPVAVVEDVPYTLDLAPNVTDVDTPVEDLALVVESPFVTVEGLTLVLLYKEGILVDKLIVQVWDGALHDSTTLLVSVEPVNDAPRWTAVPDLAAVEDVEGELDLGLYMDDSDTPMDELTVEAVSSYGSMDDHVFRFVYPEGVMADQVTLTLSDGEFQAVLVMNVTVSPVNDAPQLTAAKADPGPGGMYRFTIVYKDLDPGPNTPVVGVVIGDATHICVSDEEAGGSYEDGVVFSVWVRMRPGVHSFYFEADDGDGGTATTEPLSVKVNEASDVGVWANSGTLMISLLALGVIVLVLVMIGRRRMSSGPLD